MIPLRSGVDLEEQHQLCLAELSKLEIISSVLSSSQTNRWRVVRKHVLLVMDRGHIAVFTSHGVCTAVYLCNLLTGRLVGSFDFYFTD